MLSLVSAHSIAGLTDVCYTKDGSHFLTCGQDGDIHVFDTKTDQTEHIRCADQCFCLAVHEYHIFVGTNRNELEVRSYPHGDSLPSLAHFTQPVSALCLSNSSLFIGTKDFKVVMINLNDDSNKLKYFDGHQAPILSLNVYQDKRWIVTSCCDGSVRIFNIDKQNLIKQLNIITKSNDIETATSLVKVDWDKNDQMLAIPVKNTIHFYETEKWTRKKTYENDSIDQVINLISYSPCQTLFVIAYVNGQLSIINRLTFHICMNYSSKDAVCSLSWNPTQQYQFTCSTMAGEYAHVDICEYIPKSTIISLDKEESQVEKMRTISEDDENESISNDNDEEKEIIPKWFERATSIISEKKSVEIQESFQSTSTSKFLESRYLIWNNIGAITCYNQQIQISFHDVSYHHSITIDNKTDKYNLADLSLSSIILASSETGKFLCLLYQSWDSNMRQWTLNTENNENIESVNLCEDFIIIGTSQRLIRLISLSGIQQRIIRLQGPIISITSYQNQLWIIHHSTQGLPKEQAMSYVYIDIDNDYYLTGPLPLTPKTKLIWIGFSDSGKCFYLEKSGYLTMLRRTKTNQFEPLLISNLKQEAEKNKITNYWLLGINDFDGKLQLRVIELRGQSYPELVPWPIVSIISIPLSLYEINTEKSQLESDYLKIKLFNNSIDNDEYINNERQSLIKMFALSCKSNREYRAFEICQLMDSIALQLAIKYATKSGKLTLAQKIIDDLIEQNNKDEEQKEKHTNKTNISSSNNSSISSSTISFSSSFEELKQTRSKVEITNVPFNNPFRKKKLTNSTNETSTNDELSQWKPSINKSRLPSSNKTIPQSDVNVETTTTITENEENSSSGKRKIDETENNNEDTTKNKRNRLQQFACNR
ncbi:unnamed protein product [Rotaria sordida]|uniref:Minichromosome loss protein Mcl1 middle region domain-containing protein n=2 Tax=Rotaria sordida TaxID=392033 RepID=A0A819IK40_9BILA|nr:unnamed protein product [Rotaria sordida]CAF1466148.1 unnamed protein product [Rotaria sordida]CAF3914492.1 unnamed protein product [Rotaria sordida]